MEPRPRRNRVHVFGFGEELLEVRVDLHFKHCTWVKRSTGLGTCQKMPRTYQVRDTNSSTTVRVFDGVYHTHLRRFSKVDCSASKRVRHSRTIRLRKERFPTPNFWAPILFQLVILLILSIYTATEMSSMENRPRGVLHKPSCKVLPLLSINTINTIPL